MKTEIKNDYQFDERGDSTAQTDKNLINTVLNMFGDPQAPKRIDEFIDEFVTLDNPHTPQSLAAYDLPDTVVLQATAEIQKQIAEHLKLKARTFLAQTRLELRAEATIQNITH